jgi:hypothetical protein
MRVHVKIEQDQLKVNETFSGSSAEEVVSAMKSRIAKEVPFALRLALSAMGPLAFAQEVVRRYNDTKKKSLPLPASCSEFLMLAQQEGFATIE